MKYANSLAPLDFFGLYRPGFDTLLRSCGGMRKELVEFTKAYYPQGNIRVYEELAICLLRKSIQTDSDLSPVRMRDDDDMLFVGTCLIGVSHGNEKDMMDLYLFVRNAWRGLHKRQVDKWLPLALDPSPLDIFFLHHPLAQEVLSTFPGGMRATLVTATSMMKPGPIWAFALAGGILRGGPRCLVNSTLSPVRWSNKFLSLVTAIEGGDESALDIMSFALFSHYKCASVRMNLVNQVDSLDLDLWGEGVVPVRAAFPPYSFQGLKTFVDWAPSLITLLADAEMNGLLPGPMYEGDLSLEMREELAETADLRKELAREKRWALKSSSTYISWCRIFFERSVCSLRSEPEPMFDILPHMVAAANYWSRLPFLRYDRVSLKWAALEAWVKRNKDVDVALAVSDYDKLAAKWGGKSVANVKGIAVDPMLQVLKRGCDASILNPRQIAIRNIATVPKEIVAKFDERQFLGRQKKPVKSDSRKASCSFQTGDKQ